MSLLALVILTTLMVVKSLQERHRLADIVTVADAGMLSAAIFRELDAAQFAVLVGSCVTKSLQTLPKPANTTQRSSSASGRSS